MVKLHWKPSCVPSTFLKKTTLFGKVHLGKQEKESYLCFFSFALSCWGQGALGGAQGGEGAPHSVVAPENGRVPLLAFQMGSSYPWVSTIIIYC